jgi:eukaryotic-like serine/threonine-protein kinase
MRVPLQRIVGRYAICDEIAAGGMAHVHLGRLLGPAGFSRTVAIKLLHPEYARNPAFVSMLLDEARVAGRIRHPHVVAVLDVVAQPNDLFLVMEYVHGDSLGKLLQVAEGRGERMPLSVASSILTGALHGLHAAHEATDEQGRALEVVHRDVSPQNILVGTDGLGRVVDFGIAKAIGRLQTTTEGQLKGKIHYVAPEQFMMGAIDRRVDLHAAAVVLWETLTGRRLFDGDHPVAVMHRIVEGKVEPPSSFVSGLPPALDAICARGMRRNPSERFATAREMALAIEQAVPPAPAHAVGSWVEQTLGERLERRAELVSSVERALATVAASSGAEVASRTPTGPEWESTVDDDRRVAPTISDPSLQEGQRAKVAQPAQALAEGTTVTRIAASPEPVARPRSPTGRVIGLSLGTALLLGVGAALWIGARTGRDEAPSASTAGAGAPLMPSDAASVALTATATASESAAEPADAAAPLTEATAAARPAATTHVPVAPNCKPAYTIDRDGIRHPKPECLKNR